MGIFSTERYRTNPVVFTRHSTPPQHNTNTIKNNSPSPNPIDPEYSGVPPGQDEQQPFDASTKGTTLMNLEFNNQHLETDFIAYMWCSRSKVPVTVGLGLFTAISQLLFAKELGTWSQYIHVGAALFCLLCLVYYVGCQLRSKQHNYSQSEFIARCQRVERLCFAIFAVATFELMFTFYHYAKVCVEKKRYASGTTPLIQCYRGNVAAFWLIVLMHRLLIERMRLALVLSVIIVISFVSGRFVAPPDFDDETEFWPKLFMMIAFIPCVLLLHLFRERNNRQSFLMELTIVHSSRKAKEEKEHIRHIVATMLPRQVLHRIAVNPGADGKRSSRVDTVDIRSTASFLQFDVVNFTKWCSSRSSMTLVKTMSELVTRFDAQALAIGAEKIKTVGDAYQATTGLLGRRWNNEDNSAVGLFIFANRMHSILTDQEQFPEWSGRIGLATGQLLGTIIGRTPYRYDVFGEAADAAVALEPLCNSQHTMLCPLSAEQVLTTFPDLASRVVPIEKKAGTAPESDSPPRMFSFCEEIAHGNLEEFLNSLSASPLSSVGLSSLPTTVSSSQSTTPSVSTAPTVLTTNSLASTAPSAVSSNVSGGVLHKEHQHEAEYDDDEHDRFALSTATIVLDDRIAQEVFREHTRELEGLAGINGGGTKTLFSREDGPHVVDVKSAAANNAEELDHGDDNNSDNSEDTDEATVVTADQVLEFERQVGYPSALFSLYVCFVYYISCLASMALEGVLLAKPTLALFIALCAVMTLPPIVVTHLHGKLLPAMNIVYFMTSQTVFLITCGTNPGAMVSSHSTTYMPFFGLFGAHLLIGVPLKARQAVTVCMFVVQLACEILFRVLFAHFVLFIFVNLVYAALLHYFTHQDAAAHCLQSRRAQRNVMLAESETKALDAVLHAIIPAHVVPSVMQRFHNNSLEPIVRSINGAGIAFMQMMPQSTTVVGTELPLVGSSAVTNKRAPAGIEAVQSIRKILHIVEVVVSEFDHVLVIKTVGNVLMLGSCLKDGVSAEDSAKGLVQLTQLPQRLVQQNNSVVVRCGVHYGPVTTAVMGINQIIYDVFGTTVNGASRILSLGTSSNRQSSQPAFSSTLAVSDVVHDTLVKQTSGTSPDTRFSEPFGILAKGLGVVSVRTAPLSAQ